MSLCKKCIKELDLSFGNYVGYVPCENCGMQHYCYLGCEKWTVDRAKEELPNVRVRVGPKTFDAYTRGRRLKFAHVWVDEPKFNFNGGWEFSWQSIVNSLNSGEPLTV